MSHHPTLIEQFRSFYLQNNATDMEQALTYFSVFGGTSWPIPFNVPLWELIESKILKNYTYIHADITKVTFSNKVAHTLLSAMASGDRRIYSSFKRARLAREEGEATLDNLLDRSLIRIEYSMDHPHYQDDENSIDKLSFMTPFMRFWFAFVSPYFQGIKKGDYSEIKEDFTNREQELYTLFFKKLCRELLKMVFEEDPVIEVGGYWNADTEIDVLARTASGKVIAGIVKYSNSKAKKSELSKLKEQCKQAGITPDMYIVFSKSGFSSELKSLKGDSLKLFSLKHFKYLVEEISPKELIPCAGKKY